MTSNRLATEHIFQYIFHKLLRKLNNQNLQYMYETDFKTPKRITQIGSVLAKELLTTQR